MSNWITNETPTGLERLRRECDEKRAAVHRDWAAVEAKQKIIERKGAAASEADVRSLEQKEYASYKVSAAALEGAEGAYRRELEKAAGAMLTEDRSTDILRGVKAARVNDPEAHSMLGLNEYKGWVEGTDSAGGYLVNPQVLPGYVAALRASAPLRERCSVFAVNSDTTWVVTEGNSVTVQHLAEAATKPDSAGTVAQKVATTFKVAGTSHISDELLADSNGLAGEIVQRQFGQAIGIAIDVAIISGSGAGEPTGIRNAAGVTATAVDGQGGGPLMDSIKKAVSRLAIKFRTPDTVVLHPRDFVKFDLAKDANGLYLFDGGISSRFEDVKVIADANIPTNLGAGTNESVIVVGSFRESAYFFQRQALTIEASRDAGWVTDETVFRGVERYGFAVVAPSGFEVLTGLLP